MPRALPTWSQAEMIVAVGGVSVGVFASTKPWAPRHKDRRFLAVDTRPMDVHETPQGGRPLAPLKEGVKGSIEHDDLAILAGEAEGHRAVALHGGGEGWTVVVAADAWVALGPRLSGPEALRIGPHVFELMHFRFGSPAEQERCEVDAARVEFRFKDQPLSDDA